MRKLILTIVALALVGAPAFAAVDSVKVSGDLTVTGITRDLSLGGENRATAPLTVIDDSEDFVVSQVRLRIDAALTEGVSAVVQLINERLWGEEYDAQGAVYDSNTEVDVDLAYMQLDEFFSDMVTVIAGRQNLRYGNGLIIGDPDTNQGLALGNVDAPLAMSDISLRKSFDAIRVILDYSPYIVDVLYAKVFEGSTNINDDTTLYGINVAYAWESQNALTEMYAFAAENTLMDQLGNSLLTGVGVQDEENKTYVVGARVQSQVTDNLGLSGELAKEFGDVRVTAANHKHLDAWAAQLIATYRLLDDYNSLIGVSYTYLSGNDDGQLTNGDDFEGWDPLFEDQKCAEIINILTPQSNCSVFRLFGSYMPQEDLTLGAVYAHARLAASWNGGTLYSPIIGPASAKTYSVNRDDKYFGDELDLYATYDYTEDVQFKVIGGLFFPGDFFGSENDASAYLVNAAMKVNF